MSYQPPVYRKQGGAELVVASSGILTVESGGYMKVPVQTLAKTETATNVTNYGITQIAASSTAPTYTLAAPVAGVVKDVVLEKGSSGAGYTAVLQSNSTGVAFDSTGSNQITMGTTTVAQIHLVALSATEWRVTGSDGAVAGAAARST
jgi:hypothetical protein